MKLRQAFGIVRGDVVSLVGAGGKTAALIALAHELADEGWRVLATSTVPLPPDQASLMPHILACDSPAFTFTRALEAHRFVFACGRRSRDALALPPPEWFSWALDSLDADVLLVEADDAGGLPLKAPYPDEPNIPPESSLVIPVASLASLGQPLDNEHVYNAAAIIERYGFYQGSPIMSPWLAQVLRDEELGLRGVPAQARVVALLNAVPPSGYLRLRAHLIARMILRSERISGVALGSVRAADPVSELQRPLGAVIVAAGMSSRMQALGRHKSLLPWAGGKTIIEHIIDQLLLSRVQHITVVTGHQANEVGALAEKRGVNVVFNPEYQTGEMLSSIKLGLQAQPSHVAASLVVLGDQPRIQPKIVGQVMMAYAEGKGDLIIPSYQMRRGHPILIDRRYWGELLALPPEASLRDLLRVHSVSYVSVENDSVLHDVDTPDDYHDERGRAGLK